MTDEVNAEVGTNPVGTVDNGDPQEADKAEIEALMEKALSSEKALNALIATSGLNQAKQDKLRSAVGDLFRVRWQQQVLISHACGTLSDKESSGKETKDKVLYSQAVAKGSDRDRSRSRSKKQFNVIIYPKKDQNSDNTKKDIQSKISPSKISVRVNSVKNIKKGGILINTPSEEDIDKLIDEFKKTDSLFQNYEISKPKLFNPSIVIFQVDEQLTQEEVLEGLKIQNEDLAEATLEACTSFKVKTGENWIISLDQDSFQKIIAKKKLNLYWNRLSFKENLRVIQCFKCARYGHIAKNCTDTEYREGQILCLNCGEKGHKFSDCQNSPNCINCQKHNLKFKSKFKVDHSASDPHCKIREKEVDLQRSRIDYGIQE
ncbi:hypothetical protein AVEN_137935-1 [Araneus ventricosus]|uniref:CCHC-type domain-containing protein n=1 Tax=Araneus ventricosus TaxID=182803 RepID=A0A4Y2GU32_ARAVE|nr:hypothetical protein AVEN_137935-1 [Araneus ventricosus]